VWTLIEMVIVLTLIGTVISVGTTLYIFGSNVFDKGASRAALQYELRKASDIITAELRNIENISNTRISGSQCYRLKLSEGNIVKDIISSSGTIISGSDITQGVEVTDLTLKLGYLNNKYLIEFSISGRNNKSDDIYTIDSEVYLNNIKFGDVGVLTDLYYTKP